MHYKLLVREVNVLCTHYAGPPQVQFLKEGSAQKIRSDTRASLHSDTVKDLIRISVEGPGLEDFDTRVWQAALTKAKLQDLATSGALTHKTLSHEVFSLKPLKHMHF